MSQRLSSAIAPPSPTKMPHAVSYKNISGEEEPEEHEEEPEREKDSLEDINSSCPRV